MIIVITTPSNNSSERAESASSIVSMSTVLRCLFGPSLLRLNVKPGAASQPIDYQPLAWER